MKILKVIFGRFSIITLLVIIQVVGFVGLIVHLDLITPYYYFISLAFSALGIFIVLVLISRQINPNYIVPWIVIILIFPMLGVILHLMFSQNRLRRREKKRYHRLQEATCLSADYEVIDSLKNESKTMMGQSHYLYSACKLPLYKNEFDRYYSSGEGFFESLKIQLRRAKSFIFMEFFIIERGKMFDEILEILTQKVGEGVEVRFMYDDIGSISTIPSFFWKTMRKMGIRCVKFNRFLPIVSAVHNNRDHRKIVVVDGKIGFMCGANLADEYINLKKKCGHWKDSAIMLYGKAVQSMTVMFLEMYNVQMQTQEDFTSYLPESSNEDLAYYLSESPQEGSANYLTEPLSGHSMRGYVHPFGDGPMPLYQEKVCQNAILNILNQAKSYVYITTPYLIVDFQLTEAIKSAAKRGVDVRIITPRIPDKKIVFMMTRAAFRPLIRAGVKIYEYTPGFIHSKNYLADDRVAIVGTMNMDYRSLVHHFECGVWMYDTPCISDIKQDICKILEDSRQISYQESRLNPFQKLIRLVLELFAPLL